MALLLRYWDGSFFFIQILQIGIFISVQDSNKVYKSQRLVVGFKEEKKKKKTL